MSNVVAIAEDGLAAFQSAHAGQPQMLVFTAPWCAPCRAMAPAVEDIATLYAGQAGIGRISIEEASALAERFAVRTVPTLVLLRDGDEIDRVVGATSKTRLAGLLDRLLDDESAA